MTTFVQHETYFRNELKIALFKEAAIELFLQNVLNRKQTYKCFIPQAVAAV